LVDDVDGGAWCCLKEVGGGEVVSGMGGERCLDEGWMWTYCNSWWGTVEREGTHAVEGAVAAAPAAGSGDDGHIPVTRVDPVDPVDPVDTRPLGDRTTRMD
jgi:hypothetical protein